MIDLESFIAWLPDQERENAITVTGDDSGVLLISPATENAYGIVVGGEGPDTLQGGESVDVLIGQNGDDVSYGGGGEDRFLITPGITADLSDGGAGDDSFIVQAKPGAATILGGPGDDRIEVVGLEEGNGAPGIRVDLRQSNETQQVVESVPLYLTIQDVEAVSRTPGDDFIYHGDGNDRILVNQGGGQDTIAGGAGNDRFSVIGIHPADPAYPRDGVEAMMIYGGPGDDVFDLDLQPFLTVRFRLYGEAPGQIDTGVDTIRTSTFAPTVNSRNGVNFDLTSTEGLRQIENIVGTSLRDTIHGNDLNNLISAAETVFGGAGDDTVTSGAEIHGGDGDDILEGARELFGGDGDDSITLTGQSRIVEPLDPVTTPFSLLVTATLEGGDGADTIEGNGQISGDGGGDVIRVVGEGFVSIPGEFEFEPPQGTVRVTTTADGGAGADFITGGLGRDILIGGEGDDTLIGDHGADGQDSAPVQDTTGADLLSGGGGHDSLMGQRGADTLNGGSGRDLIEGGLGADLANGGGGGDSLMGDRGSDTLSGGAGRDLIDGGIGRDLARGGGGGDSLVGNRGADTLKGGAGRDLIDGGIGRDLVRGGGGADLISGSEGRDTLEGGAGRDVFQFRPGDGRDVIVDWSNDFIELIGARGIEEVMINQRGEDVLIRFQNVSIVVEDERASGFVENDFIFG